jgi:hypothetical protein
MARTPARIETLEFTYADPAVSVTTEQRTVEHETIDDQIVVQALGRKPDQISVEGVVPTYELRTIDDLTTLGVVELRTARWSGDVIVKSTSSDFKRAKNKMGMWLYDVTIECLEVDEQYDSYEDVVEDARVSLGGGEEAIPSAEDIIDQIGDIDSAFGDPTDNIGF